MYSDIVSKNKLLLDFPEYADTLSEIVSFNPAPFTIGVYGDWGIGKSTLMHGIMERLTKKEIIKIEFNAWRYSQEETSITYSLISAIIRNLLKNKDLKNSLKHKKNSNRISTIVKRIIDNTTFSLPLGVGNIGTSLNGVFSPSKNKENNMNELVDGFTPTLQLAIETMTDLLKSLKKIHKEYRVVLFVDDLDRCPPDRLIKILESIKILQDIQGIVFVIGVNPVVIEDVVKQKYSELGKWFNVSDYLKKIIQIPFFIPTWSKDDILEFLEGLLETNSNDEVTNFLSKNKQLIIQLSKMNPREMKLLLNHFILSHKNLKRNKNLKITDNVRKKLLIMETVQLRWRSFYDHIIQDRHNMNSFLREKYSFETLKNYGGDQELQKLIKTQSKLFRDISEKEWNVFRRIIEYGQNEQDPKHESIITSLENKGFSETRGWICKTIKQNRERTIEFLLEDPHCRSLITDEDLENLFGLNPSLIPTEIPKHSRYTILAYHEECEKIGSMREATRRYFKAIQTAERTILAVTRINSEDTLKEIKNRILKKHEIKTRIIVSESPVKQFETIIDELVNHGVEVKKLVNMQLVASFGIVDDVAFFSIPYGKEKEKERRFFQTISADAKSAVEKSFETTWNKSHKI